MLPGNRREWISALNFGRTDCIKNLCSAVLFRQDCILPFPKGFEAQIRPTQRLGSQERYWCIKFSPVLSMPIIGGEICIILINFSAEEFTIEDGERIAQMVIARHEQAEWQEVEVLDETERGAGGLWTYR